MVFYCGISCGNKRGCGKDSCCVYHHWCWTRWSHGGHAHAHRHAHGHALHTSECDWGRDINSVYDLVLSSGIKRVIGGWNIIKPLGESLPRVALFVSQTNNDMDTITIASPGRSEAKGIGNVKVTRTTPLWTLRTKVSISSGCFGRFCKIRITVNVNGEVKQPCSVTVWIYVKEVVGRRSERVVRF